MPSIPSLRIFANGIDGCLGTRLRMVLFALVTAIRVSTVRVSGASVASTWQGMQTIFLLRLLSRNAHTFI